MYKWGVLCVFLLFLSCRETQLFSVEGLVPGTEYDGEWVYLVPFKGATYENVDSACIENGIFRFKRSVEKDDVCIVRTRPALRLTLQELLVIAEPGHLEVHLDTVSRAAGTPLNDALQQWKEKKEHIDNEMFLLIQQLRSGNDSIQKNEIRQQIKYMSEDFSVYNFNFVNANKHNTAGRFVYQMVKRNFSDDQLKALQIDDES